MYWPHVHNVVYLRSHVTRLCVLHTDQDTCECIGAEVHVQGVPQTPEEYRCRLGQIDHSIQPCLDNNMFCKECDKHVTTFNFLTSLQRPTQHLQTASMSRLSSGHWLDDDTVMAYGNLVAMHGNCYVTPPLTYTHITGSTTARRANIAQPSHRKLPPGAAAYAVVLLNCNHWVAIGAVPTSRLCVYYDSLKPNRQTPAPCLNMDKWLLSLQHEVPEGGFEGCEHWEFWKHPVDLPKQEDSTHCGIFALLFMQCHALGGKHTYTSASMPQLRQAMAGALHSVQLISL